MGIAAVKDGLFELLGTVADLQVHRRVPGDIPASPAVFLRSGGISYGDTMDGRYTATVQIVVVVDRGDDTNQDVLDDFSDPDTVNSIPDLLASDRTLGYRVEDSRLVSASDVSIVAVGADEFYAVTFTVEALL